MKISNNNNQQSFKSIYNNKFLLKSLEQISDHSASFIAGTTFLSAAVLRPLAISMTPKTKKENKKIFAADSITSAFTKLAIAEAVALPLESAIKTIDNDPYKFLSKKTIDVFSKSEKNIISSNKYKFATQSIKLGSNLLTAIPKSLISIALVPVVVDLLSKKSIKKEDKETNKQIQKMQYNTSNPVFLDIERNLSFKGNLNYNLAKGVGKILNTNLMHKFVNKYAHTEKDFAKNISISTDILLTATSIFSTFKSKKIDENRKQPLIYNKILSSLISIFAGAKIDNLVQKLGKSALDNFIMENSNNPKLSKYINGINILRPTLIFALIYYGITPIVTSYFADKLSSQKD